MKCNVQLEGEWGSNYNSPSFLLQGGIFFPPVTIHWHLLSIYSSDIKHQNACVH